MDLILSRLTQLEEQVRCLPQLVSTIQAHTSTISSFSSANEAQASTIARLSSEIETLKKTVEDQELVIGDLSKAAISGGHWVWESGRKGGGEEEEGRWVWSLVRCFSSPLSLSSSRLIFAMS